MLPSLFTRREIEPAETTLIEVARVANPYLHFVRTMGPDARQTVWYRRQFDWQILLLRKDGFPAAAAKIERATEGRAAVLAAEYETDLVERERAIALNRTDGPVRRLLRKVLVR